LTGPHQPASERAQPILREMSGVLDEKVKYPTRVEPPRLTGSRD